VVLRPAEAQRARLPWVQDRPYTSLATLVEPTKPTAAMPGWSQIASTTSLPPCTRLRTPAGRPASSNRATSLSDDRGTRSDGLSTNTLPPTRACGSIHSGTMNGKLNGTMPATTPSGSYTTSQVTPRLTSSWLPDARFGRLQPNSTHSMPFSTSARASAYNLPFSCETSHDSSSMSRSISSRTRYRIWARSRIGTSRHFWNAILAAATAASTSAAVPSWTCAMSRPHRGLGTASVWPLLASRHWPPMKWRAAT
jgi:hypothetical protein